MSELKPIHKFNGGIGATLCHKCSVIITEGLTEDLYCENCGGEERYAYKLVRENDGLTKRGNKINWIEWNEDGTANKAHDEISKGFSLILNPGYTYTWLTTTIDEILVQEENYIKFKTKNSIYELFINKKNSTE